MDAARRELITTATAALKPEDFTQAGQPNMAALKTLVPDVTKEERDELWPVAANPSKQISPAGDEAAPAAPVSDVVRGEDVIKTLREKGHAI